MQDIVEESELLAVLNSRAPSGNDDIRAENSTQVLIQIYGNSLSQESLTANGHQENDGNKENYSQKLTSLTQITVQAKRVMSDPALLEALQLM